jgi:hypothetical protein
VIHGDYANEFYTVINICDAAGEGERRTMTRVLSCAAE